MRPGKFAPGRIHGVPDPADLPLREPGEEDPPDPRKNPHRPTDAPPLDVPVVPRLRPLEIG